MPTFLIDYAWAQIPAPSIKAAGYIGAMRYLGGSASLTPIERDNLHAAGLGIGLVWETAADEAEHPERGRSDAIKANDQADSLGYPPNCPIFFADDQNDPDVGAELGYFAQVYTASHRPVGVYSGGNVVKAVMDAGYAQYGWMVETWFPHAGANPHLIQLANSKEPYIDGISPDQYDSNTLERPFPLWGVVMPVPPTHAEDEVILYTTVDEHDNVTYFRDAAGILVKLAPEEAAAYYPGMVDGWVHVVKLGSGNLSFLSALSYNKNSVDAIKAAQKLYGG